MKSLGVYIHIPFCIRKCNYCDFCSYTDSSGDLMTRYTDELCRRIKAFKTDNPTAELVDTVYFGGGTPTLLPIECFEKIIGTLRESFFIDKGAEITVECNPASIGFDGLVELRTLGINRISIGLQSADDFELLALGRLHSFEDFCKSFNEARSAGFDNISVDIMYGIPNQSVRSFENTLKAVCTLSPEHISAYGLKIEENTAFSRIKDDLALPDEDEEYLMYCRCNDILRENGYIRYEISNFAKDGRESKHNLKYWKLEDYIGFGVAAHSCFAGERFGNSRDIDAFLAGENITVECTKISPEEHICEYVMLGLRLEEGINTDEYKKMTQRSFKDDFPKTDELLREGFLREKDGRISFTTKGFFVSNAILSDMLYFE